MPERRATRFLVEALFLVALAAALAYAHLRPLYVIGVMALGWALSAVFEWASWLREPHYGRGLPPRYYVPRVSLPPALPLERPSDVFPTPVDAPTWIVPAGEAHDWPWLRESQLGGDPSPAEQTQVVEVLEAATVVATFVAEPEAGPVPAPAPRPRVPLPAPATSVRLARHRIDPLAPQATGRRRRRDTGDGFVDVPARPSHRVLPGTARRSED